jgi:hypothetical protein
MNWDLVIESMMELIKDEETRTEVYQKLFDACDDVDVEDFELEFGGVDDAFDNALSMYEDPYASDDEDDDDEEDEGDNDYESDEEWEIEDTEEQ